MARGGDQVKYANVMVRRHRSGDPHATVHASISLRQFARAQNLLAWEVSRIIREIREYAGSYVHPNLLVELPS